MEPAQRFSALNIAAVRQQRRGTTVMPQKKKSIDAINVIYPGARRESSGSLEVIRRSSWLEQVRRKSVSAKPKGKAVYEGHFPVNFRGIYSARFNPDGEKFALSYGVGALQVWNVGTNEHCVNVRGAPDHGLPIMCVRFIPKTSDNFFAASACGTLFLCGTKTGDISSFVKEQGNEINSVDCNTSGETAVTAGKDAVVRLYDIKTQTRIGQYCRDPKSDNCEIGRYHVMRIFTTKFHPTSNHMFLTAGWDDCVKIWDMRIKEGCIRDIKGPHICGDAVDVKDTVVLTGSWTVQNSLQLWDMTSGKKIDTIIPVNRQTSIDGEFLYCAQYFNGDSLGNTVVIGGSGISNVEVIDLTERKIIATFKVHKTVQAIDSSNQFVVFGGMESTFRLVTLPT